ncbi:hypothetical protein DPX16_2554 [Anabarilius grahami]|uniref:Uncharacterized protein n=1 Tax=Anabarilius grahami TaxID=495550 RepID=A0A3N0XDY8_ANAGA|nr:hypothetical protein DPX16_2554 [Anabarilius grahami]
MNRTRETRARYVWTLTQKQAEMRKRSAPLASSCVYQSLCRPALESRTATLIAAKPAVSGRKLCSIFSGADGISAQCDLQPSAEQQNTLPQATEIYEIQSYEQTFFQ